MAKDHKKKKRKRVAKLAFIRSALRSEVEKNEWKTLVVWGMAGTLIDWSPAMRKAFIRRTMDAVRAHYGAEKLSFGVARQIHDLAGAALAQGCLPTHGVAQALGMDESRLLSDVTTRLLVHDIPSKASEYGLGNAGDLNFFVDSRDRGILHMVATAYPSFFARGVLNYHALLPLIHGVVGSESIVSPDGTVATKDTHPDAFLDAVLSGVRKKRMHDVIVVDHRGAYIDAAVARGARAVMLDVSMPAVDQVRAVFENVLGVPYQEEGRPFYLREADYVASYGLV